MLDRGWGVKFSELTKQRPEAFANRTVQQQQQTAWEANLDRLKRRPPDKLPKDLKFRGQGESLSATIMRATSGTHGSSESVAEGHQMSPSEEPSGTHGVNSTACMSPSHSRRSGGTHGDNSTACIAPSPMRPPILERHLRPACNHPSQIVDPSERHEETVRHQKRALLKRKIAHERSESERKEKEQVDPFEELRKKRAKLRKLHRVALQGQQDPNTDYWTEHKGQGTARPTERVYPEGCKRQMYPTGAAATHPAAEDLRQWAEHGCPVDTGRQWTPEQIKAALERGPHMSALAPEAMQAFRKEVVQKIAQGHAKVIPWDEIKDNLPKELKLSPISQIPHKSRDYRTILDLSYVQKKNGQPVAPAVNATTRPTAPEAAISQMGSVLPRMIIAMAKCPEDAAIYFSKFDIQDGFWRMINQIGKEYNFAFVMPTTPEEPMQIVVPTSLQMGWVNSPNYFCGGSETVRDVAEDYAEAPIGDLPKHHLEEGTTPSREERNKLVKANELEEHRALKYLLEVYVDDFIAAAQARSPEELTHIARALLHAIHDVFPEGLLSPDDQPVSIKKVLKGEARWSVIKEILGWIFNGETKSIRLPEEKVKQLVATIEKMLRSREGTPFHEFQTLMGKLYHASIGTPAGKGFMTPLNHQLAKTPKKVWFRRGSTQRKALELWKYLLSDAMAEPTKAKELMPASPDYVGLVDASGEGVGGVWLSGNKRIPATVWRLEWPDEIKKALKNATLTINDLEMAGNLLAWLVLEGMGVEIKHCHVALLNDNKSAVSWILSWAAHSKGPAGNLIMALALRQRMRRASPLTPAHLAGELNTMADVASRSFGYKSEWKCDSTDEFLTLFDRFFPLPNKTSWQYFLISSRIVTRVTDALQMRPSTMEEWKKLPKIGTSISRTGASFCNLGELTRTWKARPLSTKCTTSPASPDGSDRATWAEESKYELEQYVQRLLPLRRPSRWTEAKLPSTTT